MTDDNSSLSVNTLLDQSDDLTTPEPEGEQSNHQDFLHVKQRRRRRRTGDDGFDDGTFRPSCIKSENTSEYEFWIAIFDMVIPSPKSQFLARVEKFSGEGRRGFNWSFWVAGHTSYKSAIREAIRIIKEIGPQFGYRNLKKLEQLTNIVIKARSALDPSEGFTKRALIYESWLELREAIKSSINIWVKDFHRQIKLILIGSLIALILICFLYLRFFSSQISPEHYTNTASCTASNAQQQDSKGSNCMTKIWLQDDSQ